MQTPMLGAPPGLTDTLWDLIASTVGAVVIFVLGYGSLKTVVKESFLERWIGLHSVQPKVVQPNRLI